MNITAKISSILHSIPYFYILAEMKGVKGILLMAGQGARFGSSLPKQYQVLGDKKIYQHTLEIFQNSALFEEILLVTTEEMVQTVQGEVGARARVVQGGKTRQESSYLGLLACGKETEIVLIHDAVRPFVSKRILRENIALARARGAANTCIPSADTIVYTPNQKTIAEIPTRAQYMRGQTPQTFSYPLILKAHTMTTQSGATDDCSLLLATGHEIPIVLGEEENRKITTPLDLTLATLQLDSLVRYPHTN